MKKLYNLRKDLTFLGWILILMHGAAIAAPNECTPNSPSSLCCFQLENGDWFCYIRHEPFVVHPNPIPDPGPLLPGIGIDSIVLEQPIVLVHSALLEDWLRFSEESEELLVPSSSVSKDDYIMPGICESDFSSGAANYMRFVPNSFYCGYFPQEDSTVIAIQAKTQSRPTEPFTDLEVFSYRQRR